MYLGPEKSEKIKNLGFEELGGRDEGDISGSFRKLKNFWPHKSGKNVN